MLGFMIELLKNSSWRIQSTVSYILCSSWERERKEKERKKVKQKKEKGLKIKEIEKEMKRRNVR